MIKTVQYSAVDKSALRKKGWKLFGVVVCLQLMFLVLGYALQM
ncbi:KGW motif small protein [Acinetobacter sp. ANC 5054]|nr:KGW motif small protein [Acinetobacter sp. ANC 5054]